MSGLEIVAAVSAVVSAFHGGSELLKLVKQKRRARKARDQGQQEWEEEQLQDSLIAGEQQIALRYKQDQRELGDYVRVGDDTARERLYHIGFMLQAEIINSLRQAATNEVCVLNLHVLHEASITNRKETLTTLDELKQRIYIAKPIVRPLRAVGENYKDISSDSRHGQIRSLSDSYPTASFPSQNDFGYTGHSLPDYCRPQDTSRASRPAYTPTQAAEPVILALDRLRPEDRAWIMNDIQHMISSYQGLNVENESRLGKPHRHSGAHPTRRDTLTTLNDRDAYTESMQELDRSLNERSHDSPLASGQVNTVRPIKEQHVYNQPHPASSSFHQTGTHTLHPRWSDTSSSTQSNTASLGRKSSNSSQGEHARPPVAPYDQDDEIRSAPPYSSPYMATEDRYTPSPIAPLAPLRPQSHAPLINTPKNNANAPTRMPWPGSQQQRHPSPSLSQTPSVPYTQPQQYPAPAEGHLAGLRQLVHPQHYMAPATERGIPGQRSNSNPQAAAYSSPAAAATSLMPVSPATSRPRHASFTPSVASTDSSSSIPIGILPGHRMRNNFRSDTIQSGPAGGERMMNGRPNKDNDYWGFCKGAWAVREDLKKGITVRTQPCGYYNTKQIWGCKHCTFTGDVFTKPHPTKKNKTVEIVDPRVKTSMSGIRYRWMFLAKSHVKKKAAEPSSNDDNFGCLLCSGQDKVTGVYGGVETLMNHIALTHVADMSEQAQKKANCILGRVAGFDEEFDINIPIFKEAELAG